jgi:Patatin-like phospholipase
MFRVASSHRVPWASPGYHRTGISGGSAASVEVVGSKRGNSERRDAAATDSPEHPEHLEQAEHAERIGIACSGGGIRSAAFNLGALQALDEQGVLARASHLSAVSGGSFIASAFAIASRHSDPAALGSRTGRPTVRPLAPGSPEEAWVRNRCSYLADGFGDTIRIVAMAIVGFLCNVLLITTLLWAVARPLGWLYGRWYPGLTGAGDAEVTGFGWAPGVALGLGAAGLAVALAARTLRWRWWLRQNLRRVAVALLAAAAAVAVLTIVLPWLVELTRDLVEGSSGGDASDPAVAAPPESGAGRLGWVAALGGLATVVALAVQVAKPATQAAETGVAAVGWVRSAVAKLGRGVRRLVDTVLGALIGPVALLAGAVAILTGGVTASPPGSGEIALWGAMTAVAILLLIGGDLTAWSLHPFYKRRLSRTFAVRRVTDGPSGVRAEEVDFGKELALSDFAPDRFPEVDGTRLAFPEIVVCAAVNVSDQGPTPPGRKALSFAFSPSTIGYDRERPVAVDRPLSWWRRWLWPANEQVGSRTYGPLCMRTTDYEAAVSEHVRRNITLPAAVAISGAAVSPAMGKMSRPLLRFLLALTNVRLGVWLPNPVVLVERAGRPARSPRPGRLFYEIAGRHRLRSTYLYATDGGHVENLGLVELLRRGCTTIVALDASGDRQDRLSTLGEAIAQARSELCIDIRLDEAAGPTTLTTVAEGSRLNEGDHVTGTIHFPEPGREPGLLVFGKAVVTADAPWDVRAYLAKDPEFPTHGTVDQLYTGETFDAYQSLGRFVGGRCAANLPPAPPPAGPGLVPAPPPPEHQPPPKIARARTSSAPSIPRR